MDAGKRLIKLLDEVGAVKIRHNKHPFYRLPNGRTFSTSGSPSDHRSRLNDITMVKALAELPRQPKKPASPKRERKNTQPTQKKFLHGLEPSKVPTKTLRDEVAEKILGRKPIQSAPTFTKHEQSEKLNIPKPPRRHHEPTGRSGRARSLPAAVIAEANRMLHHGGENAFRNYMKMTHPEVTPIQPEEEDSEMSNTVEAARMQLKSLEEEVAAARSQVKTLEAEVTTKEQHISSIKTFLEAYDMYADSEQRVKAVLLERNVPVNVERPVPITSRGKGRFKVIEEALPYIKTHGSIGLEIGQIIEDLRSINPGIKYHTAWGAFDSEIKRAQPRVVKVGKRYYMPQYAPVIQEASAAVAGD